MKEILEGILFEDDEFADEYDMYVHHKTDTKMIQKYILGHLSYYLGKKVKITIEVLDEK